MTHWKLPWTILLFLVLRSPVHRANSWLQRKGEALYPPPLGKLLHSNSSVPPRSFLRHHACLPRFPSETEKCSPPCSPGGPRPPSVQVPEGNFPKHENGKQTWSKIPPVDANSVYSLERVGVGEEGAGGGEPRGGSVCRPSANPSQTRIFWNIFFVNDNKMEPSELSNNSWELFPPMSQIEERTCSGDLVRTLPVIVCVCLCVYIIVCFLLHFKTQ